MAAWHFLVAESAAGIPKVKTKAGAELRKPDDGVAGVYIRESLRGVARTLHRMVRARTRGGGKSADRRNDRPDTWGQNDRPV